MTWDLTYFDKFSYFAPELGMKMSYFILYADLAV